MANARRLRRREKIRELADRIRTDGGHDVGLRHAVERGLQGCGIIEVAGHELHSGRHELRGALRVPDQRAGGYGPLLERSQQRDSVRARGTRNQDPFRTHCLSPAATPSSCDGVSETALTASPRAAGACEAPTTPRIIRAVIPRSRGCT